MVVLDTLHIMAYNGFGMEKILEPFLDLCVSSLREGHANLLCIVPILTDVAEATQTTQIYEYMNINDAFRLRVWAVTDPSLNPRLRLHGCTMIGHCFGVATI